MSTPAILLCALLLDAAMGEPKWLWSRFPHPAVLLGRLVAALEQRLNTGKNRRTKGILALVLLIIVAAWAGIVLRAGGPVVEIIVTAILLAQSSLVQHVRAVADGLRQSRVQGRRAVAMIVSRDTAQMDSTAIARAAIESGSENLSDGVIAPAFWFLIGGLPGILIYKAVNTADSMIGYRTPRYADFGWAAARFDDVLNLIPARGTAALIALPGGVLPHWSKIKQDAALHRSPNAGWPESAMARATDIALAGPRAYDGKMQDFPFVHPTGHHTLTPRHIDLVCSKLWQAWGAMVLFILVLTLV